MSLKPLRDEVFLLLPSALQKSITTPSGVKIELPDNLSQEEWAQVGATVYAVGEDSELGLSPGDHVSVSYMVASDREQNEHGETKRYNRCYVIDDQLVWRAQNNEIFAVFRDETWIAVGKNVLLEPVFANDAAAIARMQALGLDLPESVLKGQRKANAGAYLSGLDGYNCLVSTVRGPIKHGYTVYYEPGLGADYLFPDGKERIVTQRQYCTMYAHAQV